MGSCFSRPKPKPAAREIGHTSHVNGYPPASSQTGVPAQQAGSGELGTTQSTPTLPSAPISSNEAAWRLSPSKSLPFDILIRTPSGEVVPQEGNSQVQGVPVYRLIRKIGEGQNTACNPSKFAQTHLHGLRLHVAAAGGFAEIYLAENKQRREKVGMSITVMHHWGVLLENTLHSLLHDRNWQPLSPWASCCMDIAGNSFSGY